MWGRVIAAAMTAVATVAVAPAAANAETPVAKCPAGPAGLSVARQALGAHRTGPFTVTVTRRAVKVTAGGRLLWSSVPGSGFVGAAAGTVRAPGLAGFFTVDAAFTRCWRAQAIRAVTHSRRAVTLTGGLGAGARFTVAFAPASAQRLAMTVHVAAPGATAVLLTTASARREAVHGFGAMTRWNLKGGVIPIITREQGVGRGEPGVTQAENALYPPQGGAYNTTYAVVPQYLTSTDHGFFWTDDQYGAFDLRRTDRITSQLWSTTMHAQILRGTSPAQLIAAYTQYAGRMKPLPRWVDAGAIVGIQGGTSTVLARVKALRDAGVPLAGVWLQDWVGQRTTAFGSRLLWNWTLNQTQYPGWSAMVAALRREGIRVLTYVNPMLATSGVPAGEPDLYAEAASAGYLVRDATGAPYQLQQGGFAAGLIDLSNPAARRWTIAVLGDMARRFGASGWMADFGEQAPLDGVYAHGSAAYWHNAYPAAWAQVNAQALRGTDVVDFHRAAFTTSPRYARLFWMGDQNVDWSAQDGMRSALTGMLSAGLSGFALNHSDTGGYTTLVTPAVHRSAELLERWSEMNAFGGAMLRTHEGNRPTLNTQVYSTPVTARRFAMWARVFRALAPYRHRLEVQASRTGLPIVRPLWLTWATMGAITSEFTLGPSILVAPDFAPGLTRTRVVLPPGRWVHVWSGHVYRGGRAVTVASPLGSPAVFVRPGPLRRIIAAARR